MICVNAITAIALNFCGMQRHNLDELGLALKITCGSLYLSNRNHRKFFKEARDRDLGSFIFP